MYTEGRSGSWLPKRELSCILVGSSWELKPNQEGLLPPRASGPLGAATNSEAASDLRASNSELAELIRNTSVAFSCPLVWSGILGRIDTWCCYTELDAMYPRPEKGGQTEKLTCATSQKFRIVQDVGGSNNQGS